MQSERSVGKLLFVVEKKNAEAADILTHMCRGDILPNMQIFSGQIPEFYWRELYSQSPVEGRVCVRYDLRVSPHFNDTTHAHIHLVFFSE